MTNAKLVQKLNEAIALLPATITEISVAQRYQAVGETPKLWRDAVEARRLLHNLKIDLTGGE